MEKFMNSLYGLAKPLIETRCFVVLTSIIIFANPLAILPQVILVITAPNVQGVALPMWYMSATIQATFVLHGIKTKTPSIFFAMLISLIESITIISVVHIRE